MRLRRIETRAVTEKKKRRNQVIIGILLVTIMVLSTVGFAINRTETEENFNYNGFEFSRTEGGWELQKQPFSLTTQFLPQDVANISYNGFFSASNFIGRDVYFIAYTTEAQIVTGEILRNLPVSRAQFACLEEDANKSVCGDLPLRNCDQYLIVINYIDSKEDSKNETNNETEQTEEIREEEEKTSKAKIYQEDNCIIIESDYRGLMKTADRFLFAIYDII